MYNIKQIDDCFWSIFMLFPSEIFIFLFLPIVVLVYYLFLRNKKFAKNVFLLIVSLLFYAYGEPVYVFLMMLVIVIHYFSGLLLKKHSHENSKQKLIVFVTVFIDVLILGYFKYANFIVDNINAIFHLGLPDLNIALPIGISFFTFQAISYVVDVYRDKEITQTNLLNIGLYISFFPQLIAGPIIRYKTIAKEINERKETWKDFSLGINRFIIGLGKKVLLANQFGVVADAVFNGVGADGNTNTVLFLWLGAISYTLQIFFDFAGYSDMAIGLGKMFGFHFDENFNYPYISKSISEFWRRWHISLQTWFRDYVYIPLGGSRVKSRARLIFNIFAVWFLTGLWHGANWTFIVWGMMYFILLILERFGHIDKKIGKYNHLYVMFFVMIGWVFFRSESLTQAFSYLAGMIGIGAQGIVDWGTIEYIQRYFIYYVVGVLCCFPYLKRADKVLNKNLIYNLLYIGGMVAIFLVSIMFIFSNAYNPFIYFNF